MSKKPSMGRQKIKMAKIEKKDHLQVTFSKRRSGLFKKGSELATLCGVEITVVAFSPAGKVFTFGHLNVEFVMERLVTRNPPTQSNSLIEAHRNATVKELNAQLSGIQAELKEAKKQGESLDLMRKASEEMLWWEGPLEKLGLEEPQQLRDAMEELNKNVETQAKNVLFQTNAIANFPGFGRNGGVSVFDQFSSVAVASNPATASGFGSGFF